MVLRGAFTLGLTLTRHCHLFVHLGDLAKGGGGIVVWLHCTEVGSILASHPAFPKNFKGKIINVAEVNQRRWLEKSGQWLENVDQTHLVQASGKPVLQKI